MKRKFASTNHLTYAVLGIAIAAICAGLAFSIEACGSSNSSTPTVRKGLWVANSGGPTVLEFLAGQTTVKGISDPTPHFINDSEFFFSPQDVVFDASGNLWVIDGGDGDADDDGDTQGVFEFTATQLQQLGTTPDPDPAFAITNEEGVPGFVFPQFGIFDSSGNLYVADPGINVIFLFTAQQLTSDSGDGLTPAAVFQIEDSTAVLGEAFDGSGNLFVADNGAAQIFVIDKANIPIGGGTAVSPTVITPDVVLSSNNAEEFASIDAPWGLVFDGSGNLWFTNEGFALESGPSVVRFPRNELTVSGTPTPTAQLTSTTFNGNESIDDPQGISFDNLSNLAIANDANATISIFASNQLLDTSPVPRVFIVGENTTLSSPTGLIFGPNIH